jgi:polyhydroxyalkanoate synthesis repressor PhaR
MLVNRPIKCIKKYKNRRLYDLDMSQYITVDDLKRYVIDGIVFEVIDAASKKDITNATLLQIFVEMESTALPFLSSDILRQLIVFSNHPMSKSYKLMLEQLVQMIDHQLKRNYYLSDYQKSTQNFLSQWQSMFKK